MTEIVLASINGRCRIFIYGGQLPTALLLFIMSENKKGSEQIMFLKKNTDTEKYNKLLKNENEALTYRISQLEKERDCAVEDKQRAIELLEKYKTEYESLIDDLKKSIEKQKNVEQIMDKIIEDCKKELEKSIKHSKRHKS